MRPLCTCMCVCTRLYLRVVRAGEHEGVGTGQSLWSRTVLPQDPQGLRLEAGGLTDLVGDQGKTVTPWVLGMGG